MKNPLTFTNLTPVVAPLIWLGFVATAGAAILAPSSVNAQARTMPAAEVTRAQAETRADTAFDRIDLNSDGVLDAEDRQARQRQRFDAMDTDSNGEISFGEFEALRGQRNEKLADARETRGKRGQNERGGKRRGVGRGGFGQHQMARLADANSDGKVSKQEFRTIALQRFERADANSDGTVTAEERKSRRGEMRGRGRRGHMGRKG